MKLIARQKIWLAVVIMANLALWIIPSDVVEQIARDRHTMLGRYSRTHWNWNLGVGLVSLISFYIDWSTGKTYRTRWFKVATMAIVLIAGLAVADFLLRGPERSYYVRDTLAFHRPANFSIRATIEDKPRAARTYPDAPPGYPTIEGTLRTDARGFRNAKAPRQCDVVVLGDSFAEGSRVSDEHCWPVRLAKHTGRTVYNLGMSSYDPLHYLESLSVHGLELSPRVVLCMLYEGNDFRSGKSDRKRRRPSLSKRFKAYMKQSPILDLLDSGMIDVFGPIRSHAPVTGIEVLDWLPLAIPVGSNSKFYAFAPKQLRDLYVRSEEFARDEHWLNPRRQIDRMNKLCLGAGATLVIVYAPTKAHVTLPLAGDRLPPNKVRAFTAMSYKGELPQGPEFLKNLLDRVEAKETVIRDWCRREAIAFLSTTEALRRAALGGSQVYFTYDQHWTPQGHEVVAETVRRFLTDKLPALHENMAYAPAGQSKSPFRIPVSPKWKP